MTTISLTTKERTLLEDQKSHEEICIEKYTKYAQLASDPQLRNIFLNNAKIEQEHLDTLNQLLRGQVPSVGQQGGTGQQPGAGGQQAQAQQQNAQQAGTNAQIGNASGMVSDESLCNDMLMTEKYVSGTYDTAIFEFKDPQVRDILNHIQKEEQKHGEAIFKYMESRGMYNPK
ncbi:MAG: spore coat protein [Clostridiaceae bacterium]|jgi:spore coat protein CotF|nr:spore coat protein [Clostridiaceae bacterium]